MAAAYAAKVGAGVLVGGMCQTDYSGYPDCRDEFVQSLNTAINAGLGHKLEIKTPLMFLTKEETVLLANELGDECWDGLGESLTCYYGKIPGCGQCPSCELRDKGFADADLADPSKKHSNVVHL